MKDDSKSSDMKVAQRGYTLSFCAGILVSAFMLTLLGSLFITSVTDGKAVQEMYNALSEEFWALIFCLNLPGLLIVVFTFGTLAWHPSAEENYQKLKTMFKHSRLSLFGIGIFVSLSFFLSGILAFSLSYFLASVVPSKKFIVFIISIAVLGTIASDLAAPISIRIFAKIAKKIATKA